VGAIPEGFDFPIEDFLTLDLKAIYHTMDILDILSIIDWKSSRGRYWRMDRLCLSLDLRLKTEVCAIDLYQFNSDETACDKRNEEYVYPSASAASNRRSTMTIPSNTIAMLIVAMAAMTGLTPNYIWAKIRTGLGVIPAPCRKTAI
jgi:hypothetical protein